MSLYFPRSGSSECKIQLHKYEIKEKKIPKSVFIRLASQVIMIPVSVEIGEGP